MPLTDHVGVVSLTRDISTRTLLLVAAAVQKQVTRDFTPIWDLHATVDVFEDISSMPTDYRQVAVFGDPAELAERLEFAIGEQSAARLIENFNAGALEGLHLNAFTRQPFALVAASESWTVTLSHEVLEMITDPFGNHVRAASHPVNPHERVNYLLEVCDPCLATWYPVNGVPVADFYTPWYFEPVRPAGTRYSYTGDLEYPLQILEGGYLTWIDPADSGLYQLQYGESEAIRLAGRPELARTSEPLRTLVDLDPRTPRIGDVPLRPARAAPSWPGATAAMREASEGNALRTAEAVASVIAEKRRR